MWRRLVRVQPEQFLSQHQHLSASNTTVRGPSNLFNQSKPGLHIEPHLSSWLSSRRSFFHPTYLQYPCRAMPGGPVATGGGIGANAPKNKFTGVLMVRPFPPCSLPFPHTFPLLSRPPSPHSVVSYLVMILVPSLAFSRCLTGFVPLVTPFPSPQPSLMATASRHLKGPS